MKKDIEINRFISLKKKTLLITIITSLLLITIMYTLNLNIFMKSYLKLEKNNAERNIKRTVIAYNNELSELDSTNRDYSNWDDTYRFVKDLNNEYIESEFGDVTNFAKLGIEYLIFTDPNNKVLYEKGINQDDGLEKKVDKDIEQGILSQLKGKVFSDEDKGITGVVLIGDRPMLVSARPILTTRGEGPRAGILYASRFVDEKTLRKLENTTNLDLKLYSIDDMNKAGKESIIDETKSSPKGMLEKPVNSRLINGYALIRGIDGKPALVFDISLDREIYSQGINSVRYFTASTILIGIIFAIIIMFLLERFILCPMNKVNKVINDIEKTGDMSKRIDKISNDEFGVLGNRINSMMNVLKESEERIIKLAYYDSLTGLPNRKLFNDRLEIAVSKGEGMVAILFLDLDNFKSINDTLGHNYGDELLIQVANKLQAIVPSDGSIARFGGDEFVIMINSLNSRETAKAIAEKIIKLLRLPITLQDKELYTGVSIGISIYPIDAKNGKELMRNADIAMYTAKRGNGNGYKFFTDDMREIAMERLNIENKLRYALDKDEFKLFFQPLVDAESEQIIGMEALIRWVDNVGNMISPAQFIPIAEERGFMISIGEWVLYNACEQCKAWHEAGFTGLKVSVNISASQLKDKKFYERVVKILDLTGLAPEYLNIEVTEDIAVKDIKSAIEVLYRLKQMKIKISLDDFGTGYSSLSYVKELPIDTIKIDKSLVNPFGTNNAIIRAIIVMSHSLGIEVVAEGVETREQLVELKKEKCDVIQGYFFSRPVPPEEFLILLQNDISKKEAASTLE